MKFLLAPLVALTAFGGFIAYNIDLAEDTPVKAPVTDTYTGILDGVDREARAERRAEREAEPTPLERSEARIESALRERDQLEAKRVREQKAVTAAARVAAAAVTVSPIDECPGVLAMRADRDGNCPAPVAPQPRVGANCTDGTTSTATGSGACSWHGGVQSWQH